MNRYIPTDSSGQSGGNDEISMTQKFEEICLAMNVEWSEVRSNLEDIRKTIEVKTKEVEEERKRTMKKDDIRICPNRECDSHIPGHPFRTIHRDEEGDFLCMDCGLVLVENDVSEGDWNRNFEDKEDTSQHGGAGDEFKSVSKNLETVRYAGGKRVPGLPMRTEDIGGTNLYGGNIDKRTRVSYKDKKKTEADNKIKIVTKKCGLPESVFGLARAKYSLYRDSMQKVQKNKTFTAQCIILGLQDIYDNEQPIKTDCEACGRVFYTSLGYGFHLCDPIKNKIFTNNSPIHPEPEPIIEQTAAPTKSQIHKRSRANLVDEGSLIEETKLRISTASESKRKRSTPKSPVPVTPKSPEPAAKSPEPMSPTPKVPTTIEQVK